MIFSLGIILFVFPVKTFCFAEIVRKKYSGNVRSAVNILLHRILQILKEKVSVYGVFRKNMYSVLTAENFYPLTMLLIFTDITFAAAAGTTG